MKTFVALLVVKFSQGWPSFDISSTLNFHTHRITLQKFFNRYVASGQKGSYLFHTRKLRKLVFHTSFTSVSTSKFHSFRASKLRSKYFAVWTPRLVNKYVNECSNVHAVLSADSERTQ